MTLDELIYIYSRMVNSYEQDLEKHSEIDYIGGYCKGHYNAYKEFLLDLKRLREFQSKKMED